MPVLTNSRNLDMRSDSKAYRRDKKHNAKWANGFAAPPGKNCPHVLNFSGSPACAECATRPHNPMRGERHYKGKTCYAPTSKGPRKPVLQTADEVIEGPSDTDSTEQLSSSPEQDFDVMYSYDARSGPNRGSEVLGNAVSKAVERYENKVTEKLVKEYDVVGKNEEEYTAEDEAEDNKDEDDFELIDRLELR